MVAQQLADGRIGAIPLEETNLTELGEPSPPRKPHRKEEQCNHVGQEEESDQVLRSDIIPLPHEQPAHNKAGGWQSKGTVPPSSIAAEYVNPYSTDEGESILSIANWQRLKTPFMTSGSILVLLRQVYFWQFLVNEIDQGRSPASLIDLSGRVSSHLDGECLDRLVTSAPCYDLRTPASSGFRLWG